MFRQLKLSDTLVEPMFSILIEIVLVARNYLGSIRENLGGNQMHIIALYRLLNRIRIKLWTQMDTDDENFSGNTIQC